MNKNILIVAMFVIIIVFVWSIAGFPGTNLVATAITAFITVITGVMVFVIGQVIIKFFIEPLEEQQKCIRDIAYYLTYYADLWGNPGNDSPEERNEGSNKIRGLASRLISTSTVINFFYPLLVMVNASPSYEKLNKVKPELIGLSNSFFAKDGTEGKLRASKNLQRVYNIEVALNLPTILGIDIDEIEREI